MGKMKENSIVDVGITSINSAAAAAREDIVAIIPVFDIWKKNSYCY